MAVGKNKLERAITIAVDDSGASARDLSGDLVPGSLGAIGQDYEFIDLTGVSNAHHNGLVGWWSAPITAKFFMNDAATTGAFTVCKGNQGGTGTITVSYGASLSFHSMLVSSIGMNFCGFCRWICNTKHAATRSVDSC